MARSPVALRLDEPRGFVDLLRVSGRIFGRHPLLLTSLTMLVIVPAGVLIEGVWGDVLGDGDPAGPWWGPSLAWWLFVTPWLVALHAPIVQRLGDGTAPTLRQVARTTAGLAPVVIAAQVLYTVAVLLGVALLVIPGVYLLALLFFAPEAAAVERAGPADALRRSARLVRGRWWRCVRYLVGSTIVFASVPMLLGLLVLPELYERVDLWVAWAIYSAVYAVYTSLIALFDALLFFDLRHREAAG